jgi:hypothetical protein
MAKESKEKKVGPAIRVLRIAALSVVGVLVILTAAFYLFGQRILKIGIETAATKALDTGVSINDVDLSVLKGKVRIRDIIVKNPPGYTYDNLLELGDCQVTANINSLFSDTVRIKAIKLDGINLVIEQKALSNNLQDVINSIAAKEKGKQASQPSGKKLHIDELEITNIKVKVKLLPVPGKADTVSLNLTPIRMTNLGTDNKLSTGILASKIMLTIASGIAQQGVGVLPKNIVDTMQLSLDKTLDLGKSAAKEGEKLIEAGKDVGTEVVEGFKGLLKPKKDK